ncbi:MAG: sigma-54-dependent Fis family transcriptional regulator [Candidatus Hydrogenedentes bacterium]|nr:sigma-54-dependent Fis family transcriptional regulator [Candidatus Hydrogenedentota bacterium]
MTEKPQASVLIVERSREVGRATAAYLRDRRYGAEWVDTAEKAFACLDRGPFDAVVTELSLEHGDGLRVMAAARAQNPDICAILIADPKDIDRATEGIRLGAYDYQTRPVNLAKLEAVIQHGLAYQQLALAKTELHRRLDERLGLSSLIGRSRLMAQLYNAVRLIGPADTHVLICGEPGAGKRLVAEALHHNSPRRDNPFVSLDCRGLPEVVIRSEMFGYAIARDMGNSPLRQGRFLLADGGTFYLAGIEALSPALQESLYQALRTSKTPRPGDNRHVRVDVRFLASTDQRLDRLVAQGAFHAKLHETVSRVVIETPPLRRRPEDIPLLANRLLNDAAARHAKNLAGFENAVLDLFARYEWPGNIRQLENTIEGMVTAVRSNARLRLHDVPEHIRLEAKPATDEITVRVGMTMEEVERRVIEETLRHCDGDKARCAKMLGIGLRTLYRKLVAYQEG